MGFKLGGHSRRELKGVRPDLVRVVKKAIIITKQDFTVHDGMRTKEEQREYVKRGVSQTMQSKHLVGHAVDLVPYINGKLRWELEACFEIALAMRQAAEEVNLVIRWGGSWQKLNGDTRAPELMVEEYVSLRRRQARRPFVDAPHYEIYLGRGRPGPRKTSSS